MEKPQKTTPVAKWECRLVNGDIANFARGSSSIVAHICVVRAASAAALRAGLTG